MDVPLFSKRIMSNIEPPHPIKNANSDKKRESDSETKAERSSAGTKGQLQTDANTGLKSHTEQQIKEQRAKKELRANGVRTDTHKDFGTPTIPGVIEGDSAVGAVAKHSAALAHLSGKLTSADGKSILIVQDGNILDNQNKVIAQIHNDGTLSFPGSKPARAAEDINIAFRNYRFDGTENGLSRHFTASPHLTDGKIFLADSGKQTECIIQMGMILDKKTGKQLGKIEEPPTYVAGHLQGGKITLQSNPDKSMSFTDAKLENAVFDLNLKGQVFDDHRRLQGVCTGEANKPIIDLQQFLQTQQKAAEVKDQEFQSKLAEKTIRALFGDSGVYKEHEEIKEQLDRAAKTVSEIIRTGKFDKASFSKMELEAQLASKKQSKDHESEQSNKAHSPKENAKEAKEAKESAKELTKESPKESVNLEGIPKISTMDAVAKINGMLRIDGEVYAVKNGILFKTHEENHKQVLCTTPAGILGPDYIFQMIGGKVESLADQNRVLFKFHLDSKKAHGKNNETEIMLYGLGKSYVNKKGEHIAGGLLNAADLSKTFISAAQTVEQQQKAAESKRNWFDNTVSTTLTAGLDQESQKKIEETQNLAVQNTQHILALFNKGFDPNAMRAPEFDSESVKIRDLMKTCNLSASTASELIQKHDITNMLIREGLITGATTAASIAAAAITDGAAAPVAAANVARVGELFQVGRSLMGSATAVGSLNTVMRFKEGKTVDETIQQSARNYLGGAIQGIAMKVPLPTVKNAADLASVSLASKALAQTALFHAGSNVQETGSILGDNKPEAGAEMLTSTALVMATHGLSSQIQRIPSLANAMREAENDLAKCVAMRKTGHPIAEITQLENQAQVKKTVASYLMNLTGSASSAATFSGAPAMREAIGIEEERIKKELGKSSISLSELMQHLKVDNVSQYVIERGGIAALTAAVFAGNPKEFAELTRSQFKIPARQRSQAEQLGHAGEAGAVNEAGSVHEAGSVREAASIREPGSEFEVQAIREAAPISELARTQTNTMSARGEIGQRLEDGFTMAGSGRFISADGSFSAPWAATTVHEGSSLMQKTLQEAAAFMEDHKALSLDEKKIKLTQFVENTFRKNATDSSCDHNQLHDALLTQFLSEHKGKRVDMDEFIQRGLGGCTQQSVLLKVLGDRLLPEAKFRLISGNGSDGSDSRNHVWIQSGERIYDPRQRVYGERYAELRDTYKAASEMGKSARQGKDSGLANESLAVGQRIGYGHNEGWKIQSISRDGKLVSITHDAALKTSAASLQQANPDLKLTLDREVKIARQNGVLEDGWYLKGIDGRTGELILHKPDAVKQVLPMEKLSRNIPEMAHKGAVKITFAKSPDPAIREIFKAVSNIEQSIYAQRMNRDKSPYLPELMQIATKYRELLEKTKITDESTKSLLAVAPELNSKLQRFADGEWKPNKEDLQRLNQLLDLNADVKTVDCPYPNNSEDSHNFFELCDFDRILERPEALARKKVSESDGLALKNIISTVKTVMSEDTDSRLVSHSAINSIIRSIEGMLKGEKQVTSEELSRLSRLSSGELKYEPGAWGPAKNITPVLECTRAPVKERESQLRQRSSLQDVQGSVFSTQLGELLTFKEEKSALKNFLEREGIVASDKDFHRKDRAPISIWLAEIAARKEKFADYAHHVPDKQALMRLFQVIDKSTVKVDGKSLNLSDLIVSGEAVTCEDRVISINLGKGIVGPSEATIAIELSRESISEAGTSPHPWEAKRLSTISTIDLGDGQTASIYVHEKCEPGHPPLEEKAKLNEMLEANGFAFVPQRKVFVYGKTSDGNWRILDYSSCRKAEEFEVPRAIEQAIENPKNTAALREKLIEHNLIRADKDFDPKELRPISECLLEILARPDRFSPLLGDVPGSRIKHRQRLWELSKALQNSGLSVSADSVHAGGESIIFLLTQGSIYNGQSLPQGGALKFTTPLYDRLTPESGSRPWEADRISPVSKLTFGIHKVYAYVQETLKVPFDDIEANSEAFRIIQKQIDAYNETHGTDFEFSDTNVESNPQFGTDAHGNWKLLDWNAVMSKRSMELI